MPATPVLAPSQIHADTTPGQLIKNARTEANLSIEDVVRETKLSRNIVEALENDQFEALSERVFVRGHYRKCAKVLRLDEGLVLEAFDRILPPTHENGGAIPVPVAIANTNPVGGLSSQNTPMDGGSGIKRFLLMLIVGSLVAFGLWKLQTVDSPEESSNDDFGQVIDDHAANPASDVPKPLPAPAASTTNATAPTATEALPSNAASPNTASAATTTVPAPTTAAAEATAPVAIPAPATTGTIQLLANNTCWAEVRDSTGKRIFEGTLKNGDSQAVNGGTPPYKVKLGNAQAVSVTFQGQAVDTAPYTKGGTVARFSLPLPNAATMPTTAATPVPAPR